MSLYKACDLPHTCFHLGVCQGVRVRWHASNGQVWIIFYLNSVLGLFACLVKLVGKASKPIRKEKNI